MKDYISYKNRVSNVFLIMGGILITVSITTGILDIKNNWDSAFIGCLIGTVLVFTSKKLKNK